MTLIGHFMLNCFLRRFH